MLKYLNEISSLFIKIHLGTCNLSLIQYISITPTTVDIQTQSKHFDRVIGVDIVILQYVCCHDHDNNNFLDMIQFSVLQEAGVICFYY